MSPFQVLGLDESASPAMVEARWRELRSEHHPDHGGDAERFHECRKAYEAAHALASEPKPCQSCGGAGKVTVARGFNQVKLPCTTCGGDGVLR